MDKGTLYICGTPIGNLEDITIRQLNTFKLVDFIACEDTRHTLKLLNKYNIVKKLISFHEHNYIRKTEEIIQLLEEGKNIALVSDAGMPLISDPGERIVNICHDKGITVTTIPGPTALISALILSGISAKGFVFGGFFPKSAKERKKECEYLLQESKTYIYYEAPHRIKNALEYLQCNLGDERKASIVREITKIHEESICGTLEELANHYNGTEPKGEMVLIIEGVSQGELLAEKQAAFDKMTIEEHMQSYTVKGIEKKEAMKLVARDRGVSKREIYSSLNN